MTDEQRYLELFQEMQRLAVRNNWGDPFSYARSREIYMAVTLGHRIAPKLSGADAFNQNGGEVEYKSTIQDKINGAYKGIQDPEVVAGPNLDDQWRELERYLREDKIAKYKEHYFARFKDGKIVELWRASGDAVLRELLPKFKKQHYSSEPRKDPRPGAHLASKQIERIGEKLNFTLPDACL
jgi:hypothetical protein